MMSMAMLMTIVATTLCNSCDRVVGTVALETRCHLGARPGFLPGGGQDKNMNLGGRKVCWQREGGGVSWRRCKKAGECPRAQDGRVKRKRGWGYDGDFKG